MRVTVASYIAVVGINTECCALDNPHGHIHGENFHLLVTDDTGRRWAGPHVKRETGERVAAALQRSIDKGYDITASEAFIEFDPVYGSPAYEDQGTEAIRAELDKREF